MKSLCLVTTSLKNTVPRNKKLLFLGEWCNLYSEKKKFKKKKLKILDYHWDDRKKLAKDYRYLNKFKKKS